jgi:CubicO group peptidase (beta-lactamase class C family)
VTLSTLVQQPRSLATSLNGRINAAIQSALAERRIVGAVVLVSRHGEVVHRQAAGMADRKNNRPMTVEIVSAFEGTIGIAYSPTRIFDRRAYPSGGAGMADSPESVGTWRWGGAYGHSWFVDRTKGLSVVAFTNTLYEGMSGRFVTDLRDAVYGTLEQ